MDAKGGGRNFHEEQDVCTACLPMDCLSVTRGKQCNVYWVQIYSGEVGQNFDQVIKMMKGTWISHVLRYNNLGSTQYHSCRIIAKNVEPEANYEEYQKSPKEDCSINEKKK